MTVRNSDSQFAEYAQALTDSIPVCLLTACYTDSWPRKSLSGVRWRRRSVVRSRRISLSAHAV